MGPAPAIDDRRLRSESRDSCRGSSTLIHSSRLTVRSWIGNSTTNYATCFHRSTSDSWASTFGWVESAIDYRCMPSGACDSRRRSGTPFNQPTWPCAAGFGTRVTRQLGMRCAPAAFRLARRRPRWVRHQRSQHALRGLQQPLRLRRAGAPFQPARRAARRWFRISTSDYASCYHHSTSGSSALTPGPAEPAINDHRLSEAVSLRLVSATRACDSRRGSGALNQPLATSLLGRAQLVSELDK
jgi:hypothetical protein